MEKLPNAPGLPLARNKLLIVSQGNQPSLAAEGAHLSNVIHIDDGISMNPLKLELAQATLNRAQRLSANVAILGRNDPNDFPLRLEGEDFIGVQNEVLLTNAADDLSALG